MSNQHHRTSTTTINTSNNNSKQQQQQQQQQHSTQSTTNASASVPSASSSASSPATVASQSQSDSLAAFCREVRNLLRSKPNCMIPFSKFVPAYHNHYGRQCCVYQFGYTKLIELLEAIPNVVQILGDGSTTNRYITLTHREQIKRFASDLIKVVKSRPGKRLRLSQFALAYEQVLARTFRVEDYGTNNINVLLAEIWEGTINIIPIRCEQLNSGSSSGGGSSRENTTTSTSDNQPPPPRPQSASATATSTPESDSGNDDYEQPSRSCASSSSSSTGASSVGASCLASSGSSVISSCSLADGSGGGGGGGGLGDTTSLGKPLFVNVPLPKNPVLERLVAQNELGLNKPYITEQYPDCWFEIPKRERSEREIKRTKYFVWDCIELLSKLERSNFSVPFSKFIPAYHYYFNRQCKVSIFGFSKLIDLFESISPDVVEIIEQGPGEEKLIKLAKKHWPQRPIDCGPTEEELLELERELEDYEQMQNQKRSNRMAAIF